MDYRKAFECRINLETQPHPFWNLSLQRCPLRIGDSVSAENYINVDFSACSPGPKDMLDAWLAAATVKEFVKGRGTEVGGGDGLGTIILPRPLPEPVIREVLSWPD